MKKNYLILTFIIVLILIIVLIFSYTSYFQNTNKEAGTKQEENTKVSEYLRALDLIEEGNSYVIEVDRDDNCFPYRYYNRGCYYRSGKEDTTSFNGVIPGYINLTQDEIIKLCYKFAHKGATAYCLNFHKEKEKCLDYAGENNYLIRICELDVEAGETIPYGNPGPKDTGEEIPLVKYSELK